MVPGQLSLFDFSERKQSSHAAAAIAANHLGGSKDDVCLVTRVGDALQEPFWPEGLGVNRGFLGALDCADLVQAALPILSPASGHPPSTIADFSPIIERREALYHLTKRLNSTNRLTELKPHSVGGLFAYTLDPCTRYTLFKASASGKKRVGAFSHTSTARPTTDHAVPLRPRMAFHAAGGPTRTW